MAQWSGFDLFGPRLASESVVRHRLTECLFLWPIACLVVGWFAFFRKRRSARTARVWPLLVVPVVLAVICSAMEAGKFYAEYVARSKTGIPVGLFWIDIGLPLISVALPLIESAVLSLLLVSHASFWRQSITPGVCPVCNYDLTGNVSGRCPECGSLIVNDPTIPRWFFAQESRWVPELMLFPDAQARYEAWQQAQRQSARAGWVWGLLMLVALAVLLVGQLRAESTPTFQYAALAICLTLCVPSVLKMRSLIRRNLRTQLLARGLCPESGVQLEQGRCVACGTPSKP